MYRLRFSRRAKKDLLSLPREHRIHIGQVLKKFAADPGKHYDVVKVKNSPKVAPRYRIRIGEYRAMFFIWHDMLLIEIITIGKKENFSY